MDKVDRDPYFKSQKDERKSKSSIMGSSWRSKDEGASNDNHKKRLNARSSEFNTNFRKSKIMQSLQNKFKNLLKQEKSKKGKRPYKVIKEIAESRLKHL